MTHPDYQPDDFGLPLSDDAVIMLRFVNEKRRQIRRLRNALPAVFLAGSVAGIVGFEFFWQILSLAT